LKIKASKGWDVFTEKHSVISEELSK